MPRSVSSVTTLAASQSTPSAGLTGASQTFSTPSSGAIQASWEPSGDSRGLTRSGLPNSTVNGIRSAMPLAYHEAMKIGEPGSSRTAWLIRAWGLANWSVMDGHPEALIDLDAIQANVAALCRHVGAAQVMAVVKSEGYGHGMLQSARASLAGGATWLGVVHVADAIKLRKAGFTAPVLSLLGSPDAPHADAIRHDVDLTVGTVALVDQIARAAPDVGKPARLHLEADTGMCRGGATSADWPGLVHAARAAEAAGRVQVVGLGSHFACADIPGHPSVGHQLSGLHEAAALPHRTAIRPAARAGP